MKFLYDIGCYNSILDALNNTIQRLNLQLLDAVKSNSFEIIKTLIRKGAQINIKDEVSSDVIIVNHM